MSAIKIGIVEDEVIIADHIVSMLTKLGYQVAEPAASYAEALSMVEAEKPDLLLLDVQLRGKKDGVDVAAKMKETYDIPVIFLTANADSGTVNRAKITAPGGYLIKPFTKDDLYSAIEICLHNRTVSGAAAKADGGSATIADTALFIKDGQAFTKVRFADVLYLESEHVYIHVHTPAKTFLVRSSLQDYLAHFNPSQFLRIHRGYVINLEHLQTVHAEFVVINNRQLPVGKSFREALLRRLKLG